MYVDQSEGGFEEKLRRAARNIKAEAEGRCCGGCAHAVLSSLGTGYCTRNTNLDGNSLQIYYPRAPACRTGFEATHSRD